MTQKAGSMAITVVARPDGKFHVQLDWRPNETGVFTRRELLALAAKLVAVAGMNAPQVQQGAFGAAWARVNEVLELTR